MTDQTSSRVPIPRAAWAIGAVGLALAVVGAVLFVVPSAGGATADSAESKQVITRVKDFAVAYNTYDVADPEDYQQRLSGLLTPDYDAEFVQVTTALFEAIADKEQKSGDAVVRDVAVESIDDDSAVALVVVDATVTNTDNKGEVLRQFRWSVNLQKADGQWRVSQFESVAAQPADAEPVPTDGTPAPTGEPTPAPSASATTPEQGEGE